MAKMDEVAKEVVSKSKEVKTPILQHRPKKEDKKPKEEVVVPDYKLLKFEMGATINVGQYENIQPKIELEVGSLEKGTEIAMGYIGDLSKKYSINGKIKKNEISAVVKLKSFNEPDVEVDFEPISHTYTYKGEKLVSGTNYLKKFYKEFNSEAIAKVCAKSWEVDEKSILDMWKSNGEIASTLGTLFDEALQHYSKFYEMGEKIKAKTGKENPAMPKHPIIKSMIEAFHALPRAEGVVSHQIFVTDVKNGFCGQIDYMIITGEKKCILKDFKVQIGANVEDKNNKALPPFNELPATKLTKYSLQLNFYRELLERTGWTVEKLEAVVLEDSWVVYPLENIKVIQ